MKLSDLHEQVREYERYLAPGSETAMYGDWCERMRVVSGGSLPEDDGEWDTIDILDAEAGWWLAAYALLEARGDEYDDLQDIYDQVRVTPAIES